MECSLGVLSNTAWRLYSMPDNFLKMPEYYSDDSDIVQKSKSQTKDAIISLII